MEKKKTWKSLQLFFKKISIFFFAFLHVISDFQQKKHAKIIIAADFGTSGGYTHIKSISVSRNLVMTNELSIKVKSKRESCKL